MEIDHFTVALFLPAALAPPIATFRTGEHLWADLQTPEQPLLPAFPPSFLACVQNRWQQDSLIVYVGGRIML